jgi:GDP-4-dehydro-6-deoxy-D-mannose reductase
MRALVTGASGFAGTWLCRHLEASGDEVLGPEFEITDHQAVAAALATHRPEAIYHLAGQANVGASWTDPHTTFAVNATGTLNVVQAALALAEPPRVLVVGSAEVYGTVSANDLPVREDRLLRPASPYAASKAAAESVALQTFWGNRLPVMVARSFNHIGPGQSDSFVVSALARRVVEARRAGQVSIQVGNLSPRRDFTDVRDVVRAYRMIITNGSPGTAYNVCSGVSISVGEVANLLVTLDAAHEQSEAGSQYRIEPLALQVDPALQRPVDVPELLGDCSLLQTDTAWRPLLSVEDTLNEVLAYWRSATV